ncbi:Uncharacterized protein HSRCO_1331 [Halanaeroarchaeum sp. HSR-CO]|uniref:hypothetical protein n=1 Tax=Halanaeroarchaeum sp. HSR-CO TaxID=2866382 RepID=UPI00217D70DD|nr:hypothetical protein [Halanaeroarchaeum sp. HSR-CO]UWG47614.1 Uncharacterized protein HSRCO_1331 [Halanaeroarchaeum sp. HSR-CO]
MTTIPRRRFVLYASGVLVTLAGCSSNGGDGADGSDGEDGSEGADDGGEEPTSADGAGQSDDGTAPQLGETIEFPDSYAMTATISMDGESTEMDGRFYQGDVYWQFEQDGQQMEWYRIGDASYVVTQGQCFRGTIHGGMNEDATDPEGFSSDAAAHPDIEPVGRDTIDGDAVWVYEVRADDAAPSGEVMKYYVSTDTGYPRRIESTSMQWDFHSWGDVDPIQAPDGDCQEMPGSGMSTTGGY